MAAMESIDIAIVGGGPAGLTAGLYAARARRRVVLWEGAVLGGQIAMAGRVENYPGFVEGIDGPELSLRMHEQAERDGMETRYAPVSAIERDGTRYVLRTDGEPVAADAVIVTVGGERRRLDVPGEAEFEGRGVSYCASCDAHFFAGQDVAVAGGGDAALDEALVAAEHASKVSIIHRSDLRATRVLQERVAVHPRIELASNTAVAAATGSDAGLSALELSDLRDGTVRTLPVSGLFVFIGQSPATGLLSGLLRLDAGGHAPVDAWMATELPGLYCAGEARAHSARQVVTAAGDGATAAIAADRYLSDRST